MLTVSLHRSYETHALAPGQPGDVVLFDVVLQLSPDGDVGLHPVQMGLIPERRRATQVSPFLFIS